jgi:predicted enzyme related to lactoylglutathione lyase
MQETPVPGYFVVAENGDGIPGGIGDSRDRGPGQVTVYVEVPDVREALSDVEDLGGTIVRRPEEIPQLGLIFALFADPEGHVVGLQQRKAQRREP